MASLGEQLRLARKARDKSLEDISKATNIGKNYLEALEEDEYDIFPSPTYVKGFLSAYARCVGLDPKTALAQYDKLIAFNKLQERDAIRSIAHRRGKRRVIWERVVILVLALLSIIACLVGLILKRF